MLTGRSVMVSATALGILPTLVVIGTYLIAASESHVPWCMPLWDSCSSISATGRHGTAFYFFKAGMIPLSGLYLFYWLDSNRRINQLGDPARVVARLGLVASLALLCYTLALGAVGEQFQLLRRIGIVLYFTLTYFCQLQILYRLRRLADLPASAQPALLLLMLLIGLVSLLWDAFLGGYDRVEDAFEWNIALLLHLNFLAAAFDWYRLEGQPP